MAFKWEPIIQLKWCENVQTFTRWSKDLCFSCKKPSLLFRHLTYFPCNIHSAYCIHSVFMILWSVLEYDPINIAKLLCIDDFRQHRRKRKLDKITVVEIENSVSVTIRNRFDLSFLVWKLSSFVDWWNRIIIIVN